jgi:hypothetical protein
MVYLSCMGSRVWQAEAAASTAHTRANAESCLRGPCRILETYSHERPDRMYLIDLCWNERRQVLCCIVLYEPALLEITLPTPTAPVCTTTSLEIDREMDMALIDVCTQTGDYFVSSTVDESVVRVSAESHSVLWSLGEHSVRALRFFLSPAGHAQLVTSNGLYISVLDAKDGSVLRQVVNAEPIPIASLRDITHNPLTNHWYALDKEYHRVCELNDQFEAISVIQVDPTACTLAVDGAGSLIVAGGEENSVVVHTSTGIVPYPQISFPTKVIFVPRRGLIMLCNPSFLPEADALDDAPEFSELYWFPARE